jgi:hypothetical protein
VGKQIEMFAPPPEDADDLLNRELASMRLDQMRREDTRPRRARHRTVRLCPSCGARVTIEA